MPEKSVSVLLIDAGNTRCKWQLRHAGVIQAAGAAAYDALPESWPDAARVLVASVGEHAALQQVLQQWFGERLHWLSQPLPDYPHFHHCYPQPQRLGVDRWLAMLGARTHGSGNVLVVDAGTALTIDLMNAANQHEGGFIVPGLELAQQALFNNTARVRPFVDEQVQTALVPGRDTLSCVSAGVQRQLLALVMSVVQDYPDYRLFISGGDGHWLAQQLAVPPSPHLIFEGMESLCAGYF